MNNKNFKYLAFNLSFLSLILNGISYASTEQLTTPEETENPAIKLQFKDLAVDKLDNLVTKYQKEISQLGSEKQERAQIDSKAVYLNEQKNQKTLTADDFLNSLNAYLKQPVYGEHLHTDIEALNAKIVTELKDVESYFANRTLNPQETVLYSRVKLKTRTIMEDIVLGAKWIEHIVSKHGSGNVLFLGRSPCFIQLAYEELCRLSYPERLTNNHILHQSFSGSPDIDNVRTDDDYQDHLKNISRNYVSRSRLKIVCNYMDKLGLSKVQSKIYLTDLIVTGTSINSYLRLLRYYYESHLKRPVPEVHFIALNLSLTQVHKEPKHGIYEYDGTKGSIEFTENPEIGVKSVILPASGIKLCETTCLYILDNNYFQAHMLHGVEFPAQEWRGDALGYVQKGGSIHEITYSRLRPQITKYLQLYQLMEKREADKNK